MKADAKKVEAKKYLIWVLAKVVVRTESEYEEALVVGHQVNNDIDDLKKFRNILMANTNGDGRTTFELFHQ